MVANPDPELQQQLTSIVARFVALDSRLKMLEDRVEVVWERTISHESRLQEIEEADEDDSTA